MILCFVINFDCSDIRDWENPFVDVIAFLGRPINCLNLCKYKEMISCILYEILFLALVVIQARSHCIIKDSQLMREGVEMLNVEC